jgi:hypothetical protein
MRPVVRLGGLVSAVVLSTMLVSPPSFAAKSLTVSCTASGGSVSFPSGTAVVAVVATLDSGASVSASTSVSPKRADVAVIGTDGVLVNVEATALSQTGKVLASGTATCS